MIQSRCSSSIHRKILRLVFLAAILVLKKTSAFGPVSHTTFTRVAFGRAAVQRRASTTVEDIPTDLEALGWQPFFADQLPLLDVPPGSDSDVTPVRITEIRVGEIYVAGSDMNTVLPSTNKHRSSPAIAVGDWLLVDKSLRRTHLLRRKSFLKRMAPGRGDHRRTQPLAANLDTAFVVSSCNQDFNVARLERYVAMALEAHVEPIIVLTKRDLCEMDADDDEDGGAWLLDYYHTQASAITGVASVISLDARSDAPAALLSPWLRPGRTVALLGSSGVGKSTLLNSLYGAKIADTAEIHVDSGQGRHTTTRRKMYFLPAGGLVVDTPGLRELRLVDAGEGVKEVFGDLLDLAAQCRFADCTHRVEPGCRILEGLESGEVDGERLKRWEKLLEEEKEEEKRMERSKGKGRVDGRGSDEQGNCRRGSGKKSKVKRKKKKKK